MKSVFSSSICDDLHTVEPSEGNKYSLHIMMADFIRIDTYIGKKSKKQVVWIPKIKYKLPDDCIQHVLVECFEEKHCMITFYVRMSSRIMNKSNMVNEQYLHDTSTRSSKYPIARQSPTTWLTIYSWYRHYASSDTLSNVEPGSEL